MPEAKHPAKRAHARTAGAPTVSDDGTRTLVKSVSLTQAELDFFQGLGEGSLTKGLRIAKERLQAQKD